LARSTGRLDAMTTGRSGMRHEAFFYANTAEFVHAMVPFIEEGQQAGESVLVAVTAPNRLALRAALAGRLAGVRFVEMESAGRNPGRIISLWRDFVAARNGHGVRGIGEPVWAGRSKSELVECQHHETLLNLAFDDGPRWRLVCPYDTTRLPAAVLDQVRANHPTVSGARGSAASHSYAPSYRDVLRDPLPPAPAELAGELPFELADLPQVRRMVSLLTAPTDASPRRQTDYLTAVNEVATNSVRYGGGAGLLRIWWESDGLVTEITDRGVIEAPLVGRMRPTPGPDGGYGLWLVHQLCDLVQLRSDPASGTVVRMLLRTRVAQPSR